MISEQRRYPFKFLDAYSKADKDIFFGRNTETNILYEMLFTTNILLLYGASGTGKSSLIQCGLASKFESHDWLSIFIRRNNNMGNSLQAAVEDEIRKVGGNTTKYRLNELVAGFKQLYLETFRPIYLIFDQFEELFISGNRKEQEDFIRQAKTLLDSDLPIKMIFSIREEYLGHLSFIEKVFPELLAKKLRLEAMDFYKTRSVLHSALNSDKSLIIVPKEEQNAVYEMIFTKVRGNEKSLTIQLPYLQVFLHNLYHDIIEKKPDSVEVEFTLKAVESTGDMGDVLREFLEDEVRRIAASGLTTEPMLWSVLSTFSTLEGTKEHVFLRDIEKTFPFINVLPTIIDELVSRKILRRLESDGAFELMHDSLAQKITEKRSEKDIALLEIRRLIRSQLNISKKTGEGFTERQLNIIDAYRSDLETNDLLNDEELNLLRSSRKNIQEIKKQEKEKQELELLKAREDARQAELANEQMKRKNRLITALFVGFIAVVLIGFGLFINNRSSREAEKKAGVAKQDSLAKQMRQKNVAARFLQTGIEFEKLGVDSFARDSYKQGLDTLEDYPNESIYKELQKHLAK